MPFDTSLAPDTKASGVISRSQTAELVGGDAFVFQHHGDAVADVDRALALAHRALLELGLEAAPAFRAGVAAVGPVHVVAMGVRQPGCGRTGLARHSGRARRSPSRPVLRSER